MRVEEREREREEKNLCSDFLLPSPQSVIRDAGEGVIDIIRNCGLFSTN